MASSGPHNQAQDRFALFKKLPRFEEYSIDLVLERFLEYVTERGLSLYPAQEEAILAIFEGKNVILNTPTGSGKSLVATALHFHSLARGQNSIYTCPIKALVNEKFLNLAREFGPEQVGMSTGDGSVNREAPILCCTAEILANRALREGELLAIDDIVMDEFHYYSDRERGVAWQIPLLTMSRSRFLLMSATLGEMGLFAERLTQLTGKETEIISRNDRPVPLKYEYRETPLHETVKELIDAGSSPVYLVCFSQREAAEEAQSLMSVDFISKEQKKAIAGALIGVEFSSPYGKEVQKYLKHGIGLHHAGLLPKYRILVERLAQTGLLKVICGTDTLGVGVNIPIRTVLLTKLCKYDGEKTAILSVRDFQQISGRAGRKGFDVEGRVVAQAPGHVIENVRMEAKAKLDPKKAKKLVKAKPPEKGFVPWGEETFRRLVSGKPEALQSKFQITHGLILNVLARENGDGCTVLRQLIRDSHETDLQKKRHRKLAFQFFRSLVEREIITFADGGKLKVNVELQDDFSLNNSLALYLIDTLAQRDSGSESYALDVLTLVESILESPDLVLRKQLDRVKTAKMFEMKAAGIEYEQRMEELEKLEHPKPLRDFIYNSFNLFTERHPWVGQENIRPKSIAREMYETFQSFPEYIREYELQRAEGVLLRYLSDVYKALTQTVPAAFKTDDVDRITDYFGAIVRDVDASLIEEWEKIRNPGAAAKSQASGSSSAHEAKPVLDRKALRIRVTNEVFKFVRLLATADDEAAAELVDLWRVQAGIESRSWAKDNFKAKRDEYMATGHSGILTDTSARRSQYLVIRESQKSGEEVWTVDQTLVDPDDHNDWVVRLEFSVAQMLGAPSGRLPLVLVGFGPIESLEN